MPEQVLNDIYRIPVPLPGNPLKELNAYLIKGRERDLLIDTGFRQPECRAALFAALDELKVHREDTDVLLTHLHSDHSGLAPEVIGEDGAIYISGDELSWLVPGEERDRLWGNSDLRFRQEGFPPDLLGQLQFDNPARSLAPGESDAYLPLWDGAVIEAGGYKLRCLLMPGHTPGQMCFYLEEQGAMFTGDHILFDITPNITAWSGVEDSLGDYLKSLDAIRAYDVRRALPGHRGGGDLRARVDALKDHHRARLDEAHRLVRENPGKTAYELAGLMTWQIRARSWADFPLTQKWFAVGECMAHLDYLRVRDLIRREDDGGVRRYFAN